MTMEAFIDMFKKEHPEFKVEPRYLPCSQPIKIKVKSYSLSDSGMNIEFYTKEDAELFYDNLDKEIELIFNSPE